MLANAKDVANIPLGRVGLYSASVQGDLYNQGVMSLSKLMGGEGDPRIAKQETLQSIFEKYGNPETPEEAKQIADALLAEGFPNEAQKFMDFSLELKNSIPQTTYTMEKIATEDKDGNDVTETWQIDNNGNLIKKLATQTKDKIDKDLTTKETTMEMAAELNQCAINAGGWKNSDQTCKDAVFKTYKEMNRAGADEKGMGEASILNSRAIQTAQTEIYLNSDDSAKSVISIEQSINMLDDIYSGTAGEGISGFKRLLVGFGLADATVNASEEGFLRNSMQSVTDWIQKTKGSISDKEMDSFIAASPSLQNTKAGNLLILTTMKNMAQYSIDLETEWNRWKTEADRTARATGIAPSQVDWRTHLAKWYRDSGKKPKAPSAAEIQAAIEGGNLDDSDVSDEDTFDSEFTYTVR